MFFGVEGNPLLRARRWRPSDTFNIRAQRFLRDERGSFLQGLFLSYANPLVAAGAITMQFMCRDSGCLLTPHLHILVLNSFFQGPRSLRT